MIPSKSLPENEQAAKLERQNHELLILNKIAAALNQEANLTQALRSALAQVAELFNLQTGWVFLLDHTSEKFYTAATQNLPPALGRNPRRMGGTCYCLDTFLDGDLEGAANVNVISCTRLENLVDGTDGLRYHASIPLYAHEKKLGVLNVASTEWEELSEDDLRLLHTVGDLLGMAIERARLFQQSALIGAINERNRLAREIHDTIAQGLAAITLQLETAELLLEGHSGVERARQAIHKSLELARENLEETRRSVLDLRAAPLEKRSLTNALAVLLNEAACYVGFQPHFEVTGDGHPLPQRVEVGLYRISQEAINNVVEHAQAKNLHLTLIIMPEKVRLSIQDDGIGFDPDAIPDGHYGLIGLNERVKLLGGRLKIRSEIGVGTLIEAHIPLEPNNE